MLAPRPLTVFAIAAGLLLFVMSGWMAWRVYRGGRAPQIARQQQSTPQPTLQSADTSSAPAAVEKSGNHVAIDVHRRYPAPLPTYSKDLEDWVTQRGLGAFVEKKPMVIKPSLDRVRLRLKLLESGSRGIYRISIIGANDKPLMPPRKAYSSDGANLRVILNLRSLAPGDYRMRIERDGEPFVEGPLRIGGSQ